MSAYFQIRGALDHRDLFCACPSQSPPAPFRTYVINKSIAYRGALTVLCVPVGSEWALTLSDVDVTQRELDRRAEALHRKAMEDRVIALRKDFDAKHQPRQHEPTKPRAGVTGRRAAAMRAAVTTPV